MGIYRRGSSRYWQIEIKSRSGQRVRISSGTENKQEALQLEAKLNYEQWAHDRLGKKISRSWPEACNRWLDEQEGVKKSIADDMNTIRWLSPYLNHLNLDQIDKDKIDLIVQEKRNSWVNKKGKKKKPLANATINRMLEVIRAILRRAHMEWEWTDKVPNIKLLPEPKGRVRWITQEQAKVLIQTLPDHQKEITVFALATGLRQSNVLGIKWGKIDLNRRHAYVIGQETKNEAHLPIPLNDMAMAILLRRREAVIQGGSDLEYVFTYEGKRIKNANTKAWRNALKRAGIEDFKWHDLRHTWASWQVQSGTSINVLMELGGWSGLSMVLRYAHLSSDHLREAAQRINVTELTHILDHKEEKSS